MEFFVTPQNIRELLRETRLNLNIGRQELTEIENFLVSFCEEW